MSNKSLTVNAKEFKKIMDKLNKLQVSSEELSKDIELQAKKTVSRIRSDFGTKTLPNLEKRGERTSGLMSSIRRRTLKRSKSGISAQSITSGGVGKELMAYAEFGTRSKRIDLRGIKKLFGSQGITYAKGFKGGSLKKNFTHLSAQPYFYLNVHQGQRELIKTLNKKIKTVLKKK